MVESYITSCMRKCIFPNLLQKKKHTHTHSHTHTPVGRQMALRASSAFRTVSRDAAHVISGQLPIEILAEEQRRIYQHRSQRQSDADDCRKGKDRKVFNAGRHSGTAPKRADGPTSSSRG